MPRPRGGKLPLVLVGLLLSFQGRGSTENENPVPMVVKVSVADILSEPKTVRFSSATARYFETQVEAGEPVLVWDTKGDFLRVECPDQPEYTHNDRWEGYPGWIKKNALTTDLSKIINLSRPPIQEEKIRNTILLKAQSLLGTPYRWGGRSAVDKTKKPGETGVDCSGFVNWAYRQAGVAIPRDAHEQFMRALPLTAGTLKPADLVFLLNDKTPPRATHVLIYESGEFLLEAPQTGMAVRRITFQQKLGHDKASFDANRSTGTHTVMFGTFFSKKER